MSNNNSNSHNDDPNSYDGVDDDNFSDVFDYDDTRDGPYEVSLDDHEYVEWKSNENDNYEVTIDSGVGEEGSVGYFFQEYDRFVTKKVGELLEQMEEELFQEKIHPLNPHNELSEWSSAFLYLRVRGNAITIYKNESGNENYPNNQTFEEEIFFVDGDFKEEDIQSLKSLMFSEESSENYFDDENNE